MLENNFYTMLEKEWFYNGDNETYLEQFGSIGLMVYSIALRNLTIRNTFNFSISSICNILKVDMGNSSAMLKKLKEKIVEMNGNLFTVYSNTNCTIQADLTKINNNNTYYCMLNREALKTNYIMVYDKEIDSLIEYSKGKKNSLADLITHFTFICNGFKGKEKDEITEGYKCYYGGMEYISQKTYISVDTVQSNNKIFRELDLLLIGNAGGTLNNDTKEYTNTSNVYARVENKAEFDDFINVKKKSLNKKMNNLTDKQEQDKQRRLKQLVNKYKKEIGLEAEHTKDDLTKEEFDTLYKLEHEYVMFCLSRGKTPSKGMLTVKKDGTKKEQYLKSEADVTVQSTESIDIIEEPNINSNRIKEISNFIVNLIENDEQKELDYICEFGSVVWDNLDREQLERKFIEIKRFFNISA